MLARAARYDGGVAVRLPGRGRAHGQEARRDAVTICALLVGLLFSSAARAQPIEAIAVWVEAPIAVGGIEPDFDAALLVRYLQLRTSAAAVEVRAWDGALGSASWLASVSPSGPKEVIVRIERGSGELYREGSVKIRGHRPDDLAHTIALLVVEALSPVMPALARNVAPAAEALPRGIEESAPPSAAPSAPPPLIASVGLAASGTAILPTEQTLWGAALFGTLRGERLLGRADLAWWSRTVRRGDRYRLTADQLSLRLGAGIVHDLGPLHVSAAAGPVLRGMLLSARGEGLAFEQEAEATYGLFAELGAALGLGPGDLGLALFASRYLNRHPRVVVDGERVLNLGHTALELAVGYGVRFDI